MSAHNQIRSFIVYSDIPHTSGVFLDRRHQDKAVIRGHYSQEIRCPVWQQQSLRAVLSAHQDVEPIYEGCVPMRLRWCPWQQRSAIWYMLAMNLDGKGTGQTSLGQQVLSQTTGLLQLRQGSLSLKIRLSMELTRVGDMMVLKMLKISFHCPL